MPLPATPQDEGQENSVTADFATEELLPRREKKVNRKWTSEAICPNIRKQVTKTAKYQ